jgi:hypothetical protein
MKSEKQKARQFESIEEGIETNVTIKRNCDYHSGDSRQARLNAEEERIRDNWFSKGQDQDEFDKM